MSDTDDKSLTTGESLGCFYKELVSSGVPDETAASIVRDAAASWVQDYGFSIHKEDAHA